MGREFVELFDEWAESYDETVSSRENEYHEVFEHYDEILAEVVRCAEGTVLEFGVGTGNLTEKLLKAGHRVIGIEPSPMMRKKAQNRLPGLKLFDGDFLHYPALDEPIDTIVSTYAFHHLTDSEKQTAVRRYGKQLPKGGKIVFADTVFDNENAKLALFERVKQQNYLRLLHDLQTEYYTFRQALEEIFTASGFAVQFTRLNRYVSLMEAEKK
ncbi:MAG TPA: class I SAM-dependent methyltransferase [Bacillales bacterium]|nr:class I SAM-dependent methyltransferase [Bacillales bacterium]